MPILILVLIAIQLVCAPTLMARERSEILAKTIIVGGDHNYPPYEFLDENDEPAGYNVDLTKAVAEVMGIDIEIRLGNWDEVRRELKSGGIDALQGMIESEERGKNFIFSPHSIVNQAVFARRIDSSVSVTSISQLQGKELIVQKNGYMHDYLLEQGLMATLIPVDTHVDALRLLSSGKHDYALVGNLPSLYLGRELGLTNLIPVGKPFAGLHYGYAVKKNRRELLALFSEGVAILKNTGRQRQIYERWLGPLEPIESIRWKSVVQFGSLIVGPMVLVICTVVFWNRSLKREVTRRTSEMALQQQQLIQADKMASLGILVSGVAHEINNPNSLALLNMPIVIEAYDDSKEILEAYYHEHGDFTLGGLDYSLMREEVPHMLEEMLTGAESIKRIVEDLKDFSRQEDSTFQDYVDLNKVTQAAVRLVDNSIRKATRRFSITYAVSVPPVLGNAQRIEQVLINLILNACQALDSPDKGIFLTTCYEPELSQVSVSVRDQGGGIAPEHLQHLTDPFFTTKRETGGTGLGLSVSATIVQQHGGSLDFKSTPGVGTTVTLTLPITDTEKDVV
jgi:signal transduction histidine kinase